MCSIFVRRSRVAGKGLITPEEPSTVRAPSASRTKIEHIRAGSHIGSGQIHPTKYTQIPIGSGQPPPACSSKWSGLGPELAKELGGFGAMVGAVNGNLVRLGG